MVGAKADKVRRWVLLVYRIPREPSSPRIAVWRKLERLGVARLADGLVGLPADERTREQVDWIAQEVVEAGGSASVWLAEPGSLAEENELIEAMRAARATEYTGIIAAAQAAADRDAGERGRALRRLRDELRRIGRRDFFPPVERDAARAAVEALARSDGVQPPARTAAGDGS
jgi:hypothetical protein